MSGDRDVTSRTPWEGDLPGTKQVRIGDVLLESGAITEAQRGAALERQQAEGTMLGEILVQEGIISSSTLVHTLGQHLGLRSCVLRHGLVDPELLKLVPAETAHELGVIPMFKIRDVLTVAMAEPQSLPAIDRLRQLTGCKIKPVLALPQNIEQFIDQNAGQDLDVDDFSSHWSSNRADLVHICLLCHCWRYLTRSITYVKVIYLNGTRDSIHLKENLPLAVCFQFTNLSATTRKQSV